MSHQQQQPSIGFKMPQEQHPQYPPPGYPAAPQQQPYPAPSQQPGYPVAYPQSGYPAPAYQHQPGPTPIQQQPFVNSNYGKALPNWGTNTSFEHYLRNATSLHVAQKVELLEAFVGFETANKYVVKDQAGNKLFYVKEESGCCTRQCCGAARNFTLNVKDVSGQDVLLIDRPINCSCFCGMCLPDTVTVSTPGGRIIGSVEQEFSLLYPKFKLKNAVGKTVLKIVGPFCPLACFGDVNFEVVDTVETPVGRIAKQWSGFLRELFTDADYYAASFPLQLDLEMKAVCLAALFLIDYEYFETSPHGRQNSWGTSVGEALFRS